MIGYLEHLSVLNYLDLHSFMPTLGKNCCLEDAEISKERKVNGKEGRKNVKEKRNEKSK